MTDYAKLKVDELRSLLKERSLAHNGNKAELVARLKESDTTATGATSNEPSTTAAAASGLAPPPEDEIDWEDDAGGADTASKPATSEPAAAAVAAGGVGTVANPTAVPNQQVDIDPSTTHDLTVKSPGEPKPEVTSPTQQPTADAGKPESAEQPSAEPTETPAAPAVDFTTGLAKTDLEAELEKRKKRASRFGIQESDEDALKAIERAKRFGTGTADEHAVKGLDEALPERRGRKRSHEGGDLEQRGGRKRRGRGGRAGGGGGSGGRRNGTGAGPGAGAGAGAGPKAGPKISEEDRKRAEERKKRFATTTA
ncbi:hypothetical protein L228DRAFT_236186 [Xylona heveae TC161]|uniref:SAP domain-containing protein n=1 Tax=Xylona heveae (strain CBS 132557 / TC161) TaxID=1328760 RepID=A0A165IKZ1_XYLHT|nr:hypothetical protein L228DRAFT_236186 [Xylona heveae TC161]KZF25049.1 hypothetical protein L228DRAFT_236186 [Xylona heveae TC161]